MRVDPEIRRFLESLPTITVGQGDDLKIETTLCRVWLSRATNADQRGTAGQVTIEVRLYSPDSEPGEPDRPTVWEAKTTPYARQVATTALRIAGYAGQVKI